jgi:hypothetical protein
MGLYYGLRLRLRGRWVSESEMLSWRYCFLRFHVYLLCLAVCYLLSTTFKTCLRQVSDCRCRMHMLMLFFSSQSYRAVQTARQDYGCGFSHIYILVEVMRRPSIDV